MMLLFFRGVDFVSFYSFGLLLWLTTSLCYKCTEFIATKKKVLAKVGFILQETIK